MERLSGALIQPPSDSPGPCPGEPLLNQSVASSACGKVLFRLTCKLLLTYYLTVPAAVSTVYQAIADPTRRQLLDLLGGGEQPVNSLTQPFAMSRPAISQHLRVLREVGLVEEHRVGRERRYRLCAGPLREVYDWVAHYDRFWRQHLNKLGEFLKEEGK